jgi:8-oxo-dGTP pyrophosphatase MutT (NUDIX family)
MYKVFIDHKPIIFVHKEDLSTEESLVEGERESLNPLTRLRSKDVETLDDLKDLLKDITIDRPLYLVSKKPEKEFERLFAEYKYIEAAGGIVQRKESFLVIKRKGLWDIPKGKIDKGESAEDACVREIMEECGIDGHIITAPLVNTYHTMKWNGKRALKKTFWYMLSYDGKKATTPETKEDITEAKWMKRDEMLAIRGNTFGSINDVLDAFVLSRQ